MFIGYPDLVQIFAGTVLNQTQAAVQVMAITMAVYLAISLAIAAALNAYNATPRAEGALSESTRSSFVRESSEPRGSAADASPAAPLSWARANLFSSIGSSLTTFVFIALALWLLPPLIGWATTQAVWSAPDGALCRQHQDGACWAFIAAKIDYLRFGSYPIAERWRVNVVEAIGAVPDRVAALAGRAAPRLGRAACFSSLIRSWLSCCCAVRAALGLPFVDTLLWGGSLFPC